MILGLYDIPALIAGIFILLFIAASIFAIWLAFWPRGRSKEQRASVLRIYRAASVILVGAGLITAGSFQFVMALETAFLQSKLDQAHIQLVGREGFTDSTLIVKRGNCTAAYALQHGATNNPDTWPLLAGTGKVVHGCTGVKKLDGTFLPSQ